MSATKTVYTCSECGAEQAKWSGQCNVCKSWNTLTEEVLTPAKVKAASKGSAFGTMANSSLTPVRLNTSQEPPPRVTTTFSEVDRVLGGGLVEGSVVLFAGEPGAGKSTLLMQIMARMAEHRQVLYASGEESVQQIQLRAQRLGIQDSNIDLVSSTDAHGIGQLIERMPTGSIVVIDSLHAMDAGAESAPGSVAQVKASTALFVSLAKNRGITTLLVNHVTKENTFAGPQLIRHAVDVSLMLQNDVHQGHIRILRTDKNRYGAADEVGLFEMGSEGLEPIVNPSEMFMSQRATGAFGTAIFASLEGTRPLLLEVQALVAPTTFGTGRRQATGWDSARLNMILAVMTTRLKLALGDKDIYINVAGGMKVADPAMDLAVALAILSAYTTRAVREDVVVFGEVGLAGEVRSVMRADARIKEAIALGFTTVLTPHMKKEVNASGVSVVPVDRLARLFQNFDHILMPEETNPS